MRPLGSIENASASTAKKPPAPLRARVKVPPDFSESGAETVESPETINAVDTDIDLEEKSPAIVRLVTDTSAYGKESDAP